MLECAAVCRAAAGLFAVCRAAAGLFAAALAKQHQLRDAPCLFMGMLGGGPMWMSQLVVGCASDADSPTYALMLTSTLLMLHRLCSPLLKAWRGPVVPAGLRHTMLTLS
jgi:hypothetical protein